MNGQHRSVSWERKGRLSRLGTGICTALLALSVAGAAGAEVKREGEWPESEKLVSLDLQNVPRAEAIKQLADAAEWSVIVHVPNSEKVDVHVKNQPASKVLELLLSDGSYVAERDGSMIAIARESGSDSAAPPPPAPPPVPAPPAAANPPPDTPQDAKDSSEAKPKERGSDRVVTGDSLVIAANEVVHDVVVLGGSLKIMGKVTGDIMVMGGSVRIMDGAHVEGDAGVVGGSLSVEDGAQVDGDLEVVGGALKRGEHARVGGEIKGVGHSGTGHSIGVHTEDGQVVVHTPDEGEAHGVTLSRMAEETGSAISSMALLFVLGAVLLALIPKRMETLKVEIASRPMRSFAMGVVGIIGAIVIAIAMCVTIIGIPFAIIGMLLGFFAAWGGVCAVLETAGNALFGHRTKNAYVHLAAGCALFLLVTAIPFVGGLIFAAVFLMGTGSLVSTRLAGYLSARTKSSANANGGAAPYRTAPVEAE